MSAIVEVWVGELSKLREKVLTRNSKLLLFKAKEGSEVEIAAEKEAHQKKENNNMAVRRDNNTSGTMSEATVCLLMDRFVPW